ncbi:MAG: hypothetical protein O2857_19455 [Planctomycetota bacterium]|nr:hypothetical protein [Planctomycetota bacterium]
MPAYDDSLFHPPAPIARVTVRSPYSGDIVPDVPLLMDTGADVTLLPSSVVEGLVEHSVGDVQYELESFDGTRSLAQAARLEVLFLGKVFRGQFILVDQDLGVLGRNVLNSLRLQFDGPSLQWEEFQA